MTTTDPAPASGVPSVEAPTEAVSKALYAHNSPVIELPDDEYDCCADVAIAAVLASDWLASVLAEARAEGLYAARDALYRGEGPDAYADADIQYGEWLGNRADRIRRPDDSEDA